MNIAPVGKIYYPSWGEQVEPREYKRFISKIVAIALAIITRIFRIESYRFLHVLPEEGGHKDLLTEHAPKIGKYADAKLHLAKSADEAFVWKKKLIQAAEESIELSANFAGGSEFREVLTLVDQKMQTNDHIKLHMIVSSDLLEKKDLSRIEDLKKQYGLRVNILVTNRHYKLGFGIHSEENHVKVLIVDGKYFVSGGTGIHPRMCNSRPITVAKEEASAAKLLELSHNDADIVGESRDVSHTLRDQFFNLYRLWEIRTDNKMHKSRYFPLVREPGKLTIDNTLKVRMKVMVSGPEHRGNNAIKRHYEKRILKTQKRLQLANWFFCPSKRVQNALKLAKNNNPRLERVLIQNGIAKKSTLGRKVLAYVGRGHFHLVDTVYEHITPDQIFHKKIATFDNTHVILGSYNHGRKSARYDHELCFTIKSKNMTKKVITLLAQDKREGLKVQAPPSTLEKLRAYITKKALINLL